MRRRLPAGEQPYDRLNAIRVGALAGGLVSAPGAWVTSTPWFVIGGAIIGGVGGFVYHRRRQTSSDPEP